jgi:nucleotide-binding universal stress UspA family protein
VSKTVGQGFDRVLVPLDFSDPSQRLLEAARRVLAPAGNLTLLHVVEGLPIVTEGTFGIYPHRRDIEKIKELSQQKLDGYARGLAGLSVSTRVLEGKPATTILEEIARLDCDLVVMGTHGRTHLDHLLIGSVTERVLRRAPCAVLTVRC